MQCPNCENHLPDAVKVCGYCGYAIKPQALPPQRFAQSANYEKKRNRGSSVLGIFLIIALLVAGGFFYIQLNDANIQREITYATADAKEQTRMDIQNATAEADSAILSIWTAYVRDTDKIMSTWDKIIAETGNSNRIEMLSVLEQLKDVRQSAQVMNVDPMMATAHSYLIDMMDEQIASFEDWRTGGTAYSQLQKGANDLRDMWLAEINNVEH